MSHVKLTKRRYWNLNIEDDEIVKLTIRRYWSLNIEEDETVKAKRIENALSNTLTR